MAVSCAVYEWLDIYNMRFQHSRLQWNSCLGFWQPLSLFLVSAPCGSSALPCKWFQVYGPRSLVHGPLAQRCANNKALEENQNTWKMTKKKIWRQSSEQGCAGRPSGSKGDKSFCPFFWRRGLVSSQELPSLSLQLKWKDSEKFGPPFGMRKKHHTKTKARLSFWPDALLCCRWGSLATNHLRSCQAKWKPSDPEPAAGAMVKLRGQYEVGTILGEGTYGKVLAGTLADAGMVAPVPWRYSMASMPGWNASKRFRATSS